MALGAIPPTKTAAGPSLGARVSRSLSRARRVQSRIDCPDGTAEFPGRLGAGHPFEAAQHERRPHSLREALQLLVNRAGQFPVRFGRGGHVARQTGRPASGFQIDRSVHRDLVQPPCDGLPATESAGRLCQREERGLEGVLDVLLVAEDAATGGPDHRPVPPDQHLERGRVTVLGVPADQFGVGQRLIRGDASDLRGQQCRLDSRHASVPVGPSVKTSV